jgi:hypothetical protein
MWHTLVFSSESRSPTVERTAAISTFSASAWALVPDTSTTKSSA